MNRFAISGYSTFVTALMTSMFRTVRIMPSRRYWSVSYTHLDVYKRQVVGIQLGHALHGLEHTSLEIIQVHGHIAHIVLPLSLIHI